MAKTKAAFRVGDIVRIGISDENFYKTTIDVRIRMVASEDGRYHTYTPDWVGTQVWAAGLDRWVPLSLSDYFSGRDDGTFMALMTDIHEGLLFPCSVEVISRG